ncbi:MAG: cation diffusion facilitator family transporter [Candidatus Promineifilaceae bacterium]
MAQRLKLARFAWLSILTAVLTIVLKVAAYWLTNSVGLLSDAIESSANLIAAGVALIVLIIAAQPPDEEHAYGHAKAEYFSSGVEGTLVLLAAAAIVWSAAHRLAEPELLDQLDVGLLVSVVAAGLNLLTGRVLQRAGRRYRSVTLTADAHHLMADVWTTAGVIVGVLAVRVTGIQMLDPLIALAVAARIIYTGALLVHTAVQGLMDTALPADEQSKIRQVLATYAGDGVQFHALRTRQSGAQRFMSVHIQVPGAWSVARGHSLLEDLERDVRRALDPITVFTHLEPLEDPRSWEDISIYREEG